MFSVSREATFASQELCLIQQIIAPKYKDPGSPTISVRRGDQVIDQCLLDLGVSVNLLPSSVYKQLGWGNYNPLTLVLADRSVKAPKEIVEDVILKFDEFYFPADFVFLDIESLTNPSSHSPTILGRQLLATIDIVIRCGNEVMTL